MALPSNSPFLSGDKPAFPSLDSENRKQKTLKKTFLFAGVLFLAAGLAGAFFWYARQSSAPQPPPDTPVVGVLPQTGAPVSENPTSSEETELEFLGPRYQSESFRVGDIAIGGDSVFAVADESIEPLSLSVVRGEAFMESDGSVQVVVTWNTNKLARSEVRYGKGRGELGEGVSENDYAFSHTVILSDLDPASTYTYAITSRDRSGTTVTSDTYAIFTGSEEVSLFDLIAGAIGDVFGWAVSEN